MSAQKQSDVSRFCKLLSVGMLSSAKMKGMTLSKYEEHVLRDLQEVLRNRDGNSNLVKPNTLKTWRKSQMPRDISIAQHLIIRCIADGQMGWSWAQDIISCLEISSDAAENIKRGIQQNLVEYALYKDYSRNFTSGQMIPLYESRVDDVIKQMISEASEEINILQTNLSSVCHEYIDLIVSRKRQKPELNVRILTLDPHSVFVSYRATQLRIPVHKYRAELSQALTAVHHKLKRADFDPDTVRIYDDFPTQITFSTERDIVISIVSSGRRSRNNCAFKARISQLGIKKSFVYHFNQIWVLATQFDGMV